MLIFSIAQSNTATASLVEAVKTAGQHKKEKKVINYKFNGLCASGTNLSLRALKAILSRVPSGLKRTAQTGDDEGVVGILARRPTFLEKGFRQLERKRYDTRTPSLITGAAGEATRNSTSRTQSR